MAVRGAYLLSFALWATAAGAHPAIDSFVSFCFKAGQTVEQARTNMESVAGSPLSFTLTFWDKSLAPAPGTPDHAERRCAVDFAGNHGQTAMRAIQAKMARPPVFGTPIPLPAPYAAVDGTEYIEGRELLRGRIAVVHIGTRDDRTFIAVDRLPAGMRLSE